MPHDTIHEKGMGVSETATPCHFRYFSDNLFQILFRQSFFYIHLIMLYTDGNKGEEQ